jgi:hypothetical protein
MVGRERVYWGDVMRRWLRQFLPVLYIAVAMQWFAPVGAFLTAVAAATDPLAAATICSETGGIHGQSEPGAPSHDHQSCCPLCYLAHGGPALPDAAGAASTAIQREAYRVVWFGNDATVASHRTTSHAQARAPPLVLI